MIDLPYVVEPPDLVIVEVLEALPGRPISGERLVRARRDDQPGFYGEIYVRGLTLPQIKVAIIKHSGSISRRDPGTHDRRMTLGDPAEQRKPRPFRNSQGQNPFETDREARAEPRRVSLGKARAATRDRRPMPSGPFEPRGPRRSQDRKATARHLRSSPSGKGK